MIERHYTDRRDYILSPIEAHEFGNMLIVTMNRQGYALTNCAGPRHHEDSGSYVYGILYRFRPYQLGS